MSDAAALNESDGPITVEDVAEVRAYLRTHKVFVFRELAIRDPLIVQLYGERIRFGELQH
jgi:hypothetical protein